MKPKLTRFCLQFATSIDSEKGKTATDILVHNTTTPTRAPNMLGANVIAPQIKFVNGSDIHVSSYYIILYHIISYYIILYHIISYIYLYLFIYLFIYFFNIHI